LLYMNMCFNKESSITFFLFGTICSFYIIYKGVLNKNNTEIISGFLLLLISFMQLIEYGLWINQTCNKTNYILSLLIIILIWSQPFFVYMLSIYLSDKKIPLYHYPILIIWCLIALFSFYVSKNKKNLCSLADKDTCRLIWAPFKLLYLNYKLIAILGFILYFLIFNLDIIKSKNTYFFYILLPIVILLSIYYKQYNWFSIFGSVYCFFCVFYGIFVIFGI
jgi:hypothetical protein